MYLDTRLQILVAGYAHRIENLTNGNKCDADTLVEIGELSRKIQNILLHGDDNGGSK